MTMLLKTRCQMRRLVFSWVEFILAQVTDLQTPVCILNPSPAPVKLYKGMHVGTLHSIKEKAPN